MSEAEPPTPSDLAAAALAAEGASRLDATASLHHALLAVVRERHPELLADPDFSLALSTDERRARLFDWMAHEHDVERERLRADLARRTAQRDLLRRELERGRRLAEVGLMTAGAAHDLKNLLQVAGGCAALARDTLPPQSRERDLLDDAVDATQRAADLVHELVSWASTTAREPEALDLSTVVQEALTLIEVALPCDVRLECSFAPGLPPVLADASSVRRVVMNLALNSAQAIGECEGTLRISTGAAPDGSGAWIEVADDGPGMNDETRARAFDPFFTTREGGTGLGLALVRRFVDDMQGHIELWSSLGTGARFRVTLPVHTAK